MKKDLRQLGNELAKEVLDFLARKSIKNARHACFEIDGKKTTVKAFDDERLKDSNYTRYFLYAFDCDGRLSDVLKRRRCSFKTILSKMLELSKKGCCIKAFSQTLDGEVFMRSFMSLEQILVEKDLEEGAMHEKKDDK